MSMTTETSNAREWPEELMIRDTGLHDDIGGGGQRIFTTAGRGYEKVKYVRADLAAPPPAAARGDVRAPITDDALIAGWEAKAEAYEKTDDYADQVRAWQLRDCANELRTRKALAAEGVQAGEVEQRAREWLAQAWEQRDHPATARRVREGGLAGEWHAVSLAAIASALSQQPEARGVVDEDEVFRLAAGSHYGAEPNSYWDMDRDALLAFARALTGERNG